MIYYIAAYTILISAVLVLCFSIGAIISAGKGDQGRQSGQSRQSLIRKNTRQPARSEYSKQAKSPNNQIDLNPQSNRAVEDGMNNIPCSENMRSATESRTNAMYMFARSLALLCISIIPVCINEPVILTVVTAAMLVVQAVDCIVGIVIKNRMRTFGPLLMAICHGVCLGVVG